MPNPDRPEASKSESLAWKRIEALGGHGVWEPDMVVVSLAGTAATDDDLEVFQTFTRVQVLDLSGTSVGDQGLLCLADLADLNKLVIIDTRVSDQGVERFRREHPDVQITTSRTPIGTINPFIGQPI